LAQASVAMTGATLLIIGLVDLIQRILIVAMPSAIDDTMNALAPVKTFVGYGLAGFGFLIQNIILTKEKKEEKGKIKVTFTVKEATKEDNIIVRWFTGKMVMKVLEPLQKFDKFLEKTMEGGIPTVPSGADLMAMKDQAMAINPADLMEQAKAKAGDAKAQAEAMKDQAMDKMDDAKAQAEAMKDKMGDAKAQAEAMKDKAAAGVGDAQAQAAAGMGNAQAQAQAAAGQAKKVAGNQVAPAPISSTTGSPDIEDIPGAGGTARAPLPWLARISQLLI